MTWRVARSLDTLLDEINRAAPNRSKVSDGSIGDAAHASRDSDHNPWVIVAGVGVVRARDFTHDPGGGLNCDHLADALEALLRDQTHPALQTGAYIIWSRRIISRDRIGEGWRAYTGSNPHDHHLHLSVTTNVAGFDSTKPWGVMGAPTEEADDMQLSDKLSKDKDAPSVGQVLARMDRYIEASADRERGALTLLRSVTGMSDDIAAKVAAAVDADIRAGGGITQESVRRIVRAEVIAGVRNTLGSLDEPGTGKA